MTCITVDTNRVLVGEAFSRAFSFKKASLIDMHECFNAEANRLVIASYDAIKNKEYLDAWVTLPMPARVLFLVDTVAKTILASIITVMVPCYAVASLVLWDITILRSSLKTLVALVNQAIISSIGVLFPSLAHYWDGKNALLFIFLALAWTAHVLYLHDRL